MPGDNFRIFLIHDFGLPHVDDGTYLNGRSVFGVCNMETPKTSLSELK